MIQCVEKKVLCEELSSNVVSWLSVSFQEQVSCPTSDVPYPVESALLVCSALSVAFNVLRLHCTVHRLFCCFDPLTEN
ncbi:hypothetical protein LSTR_LSTR004741 [Laodelphax striatellus]|uniref:Uncharacterized protein n=1 Tax=Laodelphax striatellus TaxID=195883 RepID=A0A482XL59_LAOST|nr:hypothetical protein LSTR_LSTR004741 [Laodelphax striatellus]